MKMKMMKNSKKMKMKMKMEMMKNSKKMKMKKM
jgi:hypothetical protein